MPSLYILAGSNGAGKTTFYFSIIINNISRSTQKPEFMMQHFIVSGLKILKDVSEMPYLKLEKL
jgi:predicted ABC-type ATPase